MVWIHLPREAAVDSNIPRLGQVGIIYGADSLVAKARNITLGRISVPGQEVTIDRAVVLSRLACSGIAASEVRLTGAEKVSVRQGGRVIRGDEFVELARSFLGKNPPAPSICQLDLIHGPRDLAVAGSGEDIRLVPRLVGRGVPGQARVQISVTAGGREIASREVSFGLKFNCRRVVSLVDIPAGTRISPENVRVESVVSGSPEPANWAAPYGQVARRHLPVNTVLSSGMTGPAAPAIVVKRNQNVIIRIESGGLAVTAIGSVMEEGCAGEYVKVKNVDSQRIILARVNEDGTVEPVL